MLGAELLQQGVPEKWLNRLLHIEYHGKAKLVMVNVEAIKKKNLITSTEKKQIERHAKWWWYWWPNQRIGMNYWEKILKKNKY